MTKKERNNARGQECTLRIPGTCNWNAETTVLAHVGRHGSAKRNHDDEAVYACSDCHDAIDYRTRVFLSNNTNRQWLLKHDRSEIIGRAIMKTQKIQGVFDE